MNPNKGKLLVRIDDEHVLCIIGDGSLVIDEQPVLDKNVVELLVLRKRATVMEVNNIVELLVRAIDDTDVEG
ncbi:hypothetical protein Tco_0683508 [Tanacetum coccineum]|uniref:Uncharacterized protein n=1 Tax=Tanacetum coccineum TaxID=301880 RepID=A0ABQ4XW44_9ASTR